MSKVGGFWKPGSGASFSHHPSAVLIDDNATRTSESAPLPFNFQNSPVALQRQRLPIANHRRQILYAIERYHVLIVVGETGSGKSTQIPQYLYENGWCDQGFSIVCTQPRRIAAQTLAQRVSDETGTPLGETVGYAVRFDDVTCPATKIKYVTDGMLLREVTLSDPLLSKYSVVMIDEAHERGLNTDALLGILKKIRRKRKDLRIVVCSATIDAESFLRFFIPERKEHDKQSAASGRRKRWGRVEDSEHHDDCKIKTMPHTMDDVQERGTIISIDGRQHPVDFFYVTEPVADYIQATVDTALQIHCHGSASDDGDILCFLPSGEDIDRAISMAEESLSFMQESAKKSQQRNASFLPLYGTLPYHMQARIFHPKAASDTSRRIIFATNIAETSVTVPGITSVIDCGFVKLPYFDPQSGFDRLIVTPISRASAHQRAGRAGRIQPGKCYRLYTEASMANAMSSATPPEVLRTNLSPFLLTLKALGIHNVLSFDLMSIPSVQALSHGLECLHVLGAIDGGTYLTKLGDQMAEFPTEPRVSRMLLESLSRGCAKEVLCVAAALQVRALFYQPRGPKQQMDHDVALGDILDRTGDHFTFVKLMEANDIAPMTEEECKERFVNYAALQRALEVRVQLTKFLRRYGPIVGMDQGQSEEERSIATRICVTAGFFFNVAKLGNDGRYYSLRGKHMISISSASVLHRHGEATEYIIFGETYDGSRGGIEVRSCSAVEGRWLRDLAPHYWA